MALTLKQQNFCLKYLETGNATEAYYFAYDAENMAYKTVRDEAQVLLKNPVITKHLESLRKPIIERHNITVDDLLTELKENRMIALSAETPQTSAANAATMGKAKLLGYDVTKVEHSGNVGLTIEELIQRAKSD